MASKKTVVSKVNRWSKEEIDFIKKEISRDVAQHIAEDGKLITETTKQLNNQFGNNRTEKAVYIKLKLAYGFWGGQSTQNKNESNSPSISSPINEERLNVNQITILFQKSTGKYLYLNKENKVIELKVVEI